LEKQAEAEAAQTQWQAKVQRAERFILRWKQQSIADAFFQWRVNTRVCREEGARVQLVVSRMQNRRVYSAFNTWVDLTEKNTRKRQMLGWALGRILRPSTSGAFVAWRDAVEARKADAATEQTRWLAGIRKAERFILALRKRVLSHAFIRWRLQHQRNKIHKKRVHNVLVRLTKRVSYKAFSAWAGTTWMAKRQREMVRRAVAKISKDRVANAFFEWRNFLVAKTNFAAKVGLASRFVNALRAREQHRAFNGWRSGARKRREDVLKVAQCVLKMTRNARAAAFLEWATLCEQTKANESVSKRLMETSLRRAMNRVVSCAFTGWAGHAAERRRQRVAVGRAVAKLTRRAIDESFYDWRDAVADASRLRIVLRRSVMKLSTRLVYAAFSGWAHRARFNSRNRRLMANCVTRLSSRVASAALGGWLDAVATKRRHRTLCGKALVRLTQRTVFAAFSV